MKDTMFRRVIASALALALCASASVPAFADSEAADDSTLGTQATADDSATGDGSSAATTGTDSIRQTSYTNYVKKYTDAASRGLGKGLRSCFSNRRSDHCNYSRWRE